MDCINLSRLLQIFSVVILVKHRTCPWAGLVKNAKSRYPVAMDFFRKIIQQKWILKTLTVYICSFSASLVEAQYCGPTLASGSYCMNTTQAQEVTAFSICSNVSNQHVSGKALLVPTATSAEWLAFRTNPPLGVTLSACVPIAPPPPPPPSGPMCSILSQSTYYYDCSGATYSEMAGEVIGCACASYDPVTGAGISCSPALMSSGGPGHLCPDGTWGIRINYVPGTCYCTML